jgi:2-amino-4-hydroxy-6-hydroxymethyldihydropteridine diphosphokinase
MVRIFIAVGSNAGDREHNLEQAKKNLGGIRGIQLKKSSPVYETEPVGGPPQGKFLNAVWEGEADIPAPALLACLLEVEKKMGRERTLPNGPRVIDLDLLFYGGEVIRRAGLTVPHPRLQERGFVLEPLKDLAPDFLHPVFHASVRQLWERLLEKNH